ncbi:helix-turn-helix transcriptional regulator [Planotetraspora phitsanulokensis]|uniref:Transcriptional regulator n=1 Tax=Planotetraspora phitsanulokensis TaxID=575192 RepID=A0A8J3U3H8_9ACTN|nr:helix-turn-helix transcriptional regulator [Planotetraspora phitsanulokensis]GII37510.1 transcriptional regulator [Planotetraspora phitsanulokensis]
MEGASPLGEFLRARRQVTTAEQVGLAGVGPRRRTPGLRREEVALLAGISIDYYSRLEQGRERRPSAQVIDAIARVLQLDREATEHLHELARGRPHRRTPEGPADRVEPSLIRLIDGWDHVPAYVVNSRLDVLVRNPVAEALYEGLEHSDNLLRLALLNPASRGFYLDWELDTGSKVAHLRATAGLDSDDPDMLDLLDELSDSEDFRRMWALHEVRGRTRAPVRFHRDDVGDVITTMEVLSIDGSPGLKLIVFQAEPGSPSEAALITLSRRMRAESGTGAPPPGRPEQREDPRGDHPGPTDTEEAAAAGPRRRGRPR